MLVPRPAVYEQEQALLVHDFLAGPAPKQALQAGFVNLVPLRGGGFEFGDICM